MLKKFPYKNDTHCRHFFRMSRYMTIQQTMQRCNKIDCWFSVIRMNSGNEFSRKYVQIRSR